MTSPGGVITKGDILTDEWLDMVTDEEDPCHACDNEAIFVMIHTLACGHADPPLPHCLRHYDAVNESIRRAQGTMYENKVACKLCHSQGLFLRWEPAK